MIYFYVGISIVIGIALGLLYSSFEIRRIKQRLKTVKTETELNIVKLLDETCKFLNMNETQYLRMQNVLRLLVIKDNIKNDATYLPEAGFNSEEIELKLDAILRKTNKL